MAYSFSQAGLEHSVTLLKKNCLATFISATLQVPWTLQFDYGKIALLRDYQANIYRFEFVQTTYLIELM